VPPHSDIAVTTSESRAVTLSAIPSSVTEARVFTRRSLAGWHLTDLTESVLVSVNELVTNAVLHGREPITLSLESHGNDLLVEVQDCSPQLPSIAPPSRTRTGGRGLRIVAALSGKWGMRRLPGGGKAVWAEFSTTR
jgi:anti-sigma regulatory factor (Ser/Thr protein kinase)